MTSPKFRVVGLLAAAAIAIAACGNAVVTPTPSPTVAPTPTQIPTPILTPAPTPVPTPTPTPAPTQLIVATVPVDQLVAAGQLTVCSDLQRAPQAFLDAAGDVNLDRAVYDQAINRGKGVNYPWNGGTAEVARLSEAVKELAVKLTLVEGKGGWG